MTRTWGLFAFVREKRAEKRAEEPVVVPWKPVDFEILDVWSGPLFTPGLPPFNPNGLPIWYPPFSPDTDLIGYRDGYSRGR